MVGKEEERERARLLSLTLNYAGNRLNTPPIKALEALRLHKLKKEKDKTPECRNCGEVFTADHQCSVELMLNH